HSMSIPLELRLLTTQEGPRLTWTPVRELNSLHTTSKTFKPGTLGPESGNPLSGMVAELVELQAEFEPGATSETTLTVRGATISYDAAKQELSVNGHKAPAPLRQGRQRITIFCDRTGLEIFASDGLTYVPMPFIPKPENLTLSIQIKHGTATFTKLQVHKLASAWPKN
ncbi:MAG: GH32 C-terminal domain-containing protein, partial [Verrucomicrobiota bacterium]